MGVHKPKDTMERAEARVQANAEGKALAARIARLKETQVDLRRRMVEAAEEYDALTRQRAGFVFQHRSILNSIEMSRVLGLAPDTIRNLLSQELTRRGVGVQKEKLRAEDKT